MEKGNPLSATTVVFDPCTERIKKPTVTRRHCYSKGYIILCRRADVTIPPLFSAYRSMLVIGRFTIEVEGWVQADTCEVSCRQFEMHMLSVSVGDNLHSALCRWPLLCVDPYHRC